MNKIFKVIWNPATGSYSVASETAKSRGKKSGRSKLLISALVAGGLLSPVGAYSSVSLDGGKSAEEVAGGTPLSDAWIAIGQGAVASSAGSGTSSISIGQQAVSGMGSTALGFRSDATGEKSVSLGQLAKASGSRGIAIGSAAEATNEHTIAMGLVAKASGENAIAIGDHTEAAGKNSLTMGYYSKAQGENSLAFGKNALTNGDGSIAMGAESSASNIDAIAIGNTAKAAGQRSLALGAGSTTQGDNTIALGVNSFALGNQSLSLGTATQAKGVNSTALGNSSLALGDSSIAIGDSSEASAESTIALGKNSNASKVNSIALGSNSDASGDNAVSLGESSFAGGTNSLALGSQSSANGNNSVALGAGSVADIDNTVSVGNSTTQRQITNMAAGEISTTSTDAINGSQLYTISKSVADRLGSGASVNANGTVNAPSYKMKSGTYNNVGEALSGIDNDTLHWDKSEGAFSASYIVKNADGTIKSTVAQNKIINVADGTISATSTDAVNGSQLKATKDDVAANTTNITNLTDAIDGLNDDALLWNGTAFSAAHGTNATSKITNVAAGDLSATSTDAVNGSQLKATKDDVAANTTNISNLTDAVDGLNDDALLWNGTAFSAAHGTNATSKITNVAAGDLSATSTDAVNGSQLKATKDDVAANTTNISNLTDAIDGLNDDALLWNGTAFSAAHGTNATSKITNVAVGTLSDTSTDAVNGSQLYATNMLVTQNSAIINQLAGNTNSTYIEENGAGINYVRTNDSGLTFTDASAAGIGSTAVGYNSVAEGDSSVAMGYNSVAKGDSSVAIGQGSYSNVDTGIALGSSSVSKREIVKGSRDTSVSEEGVVIGYDTTDGELLGALSIGDEGKYRQIINVADGSEAHDAVTVRQLQNAIGAVATTATKYYHANSTEEDSLAVGTDSLAMGAKTIVNGDKGIGIGYGAYVEANALNGIAIGSNAQVIHVNSIAIGNGSTTTRGAQTNYTAYNMDAPQNSVGEFSVGSEDGQRQITNVAAGSADTDAVNVGQLKVTDERVAQNTQSITNLNTQVTNLDTRVTNIENGIGDIVTTGSTKYFKTNTDGVDANAQGKDSVAIGSGSIAAADNSVALGTGSVATEENTISVGSSTNQRRITNVAAGKNDTDAVNVAQLKSSEAGGVRYDTKADGSVDYSNITLGGSSGGTTRISNVSAGVNNNDAVNYAQLKQSVQENKQYTDQRMAQMDHKLSKTESKLSGGIASAMAMTGLPQAYEPGANMASIGGGTYNGESAVALGVSMVSDNGRWVYKLQGSTNSQGDYSAAIGAGIQW